MANNRLGLSREQLATFLKDHEQIKQFERLFTTVADLGPSTLQDVAIIAETANSKANEALSAVNRFAATIEWLAVGPEHSNRSIPDYLDFQLFPRGASKRGRLKWNPIDQTLDLGMDHGVVQQIGMEKFVRVENNTGSPISNGSVVSFNGVSSANVVSVAPFLASPSGASPFILGVVVHDLPSSGGVGYSTILGYVRGINTTGSPYGETWAVGDVLYASASVAGGLTNISPTAPNRVIPVAIVLKVSSTEGVIFVHPVPQRQQYYGVFNKTTSQSPAAANTEYLLTFDSTSIANGVAIGSPTSRIVVPDSGLYDFNATIQVTSGNTTVKNVWFWLKKNGTAVANSARVITSNISNGRTPVSLNGFFSLQANDYIELAFAADNTGVTINNIAATTFAPAVPAIVLSVTQIQQ